MIRLFIGLSLPDAISDQLIDLYGPLPGARWVHPDDLHLTLRFLGPTDASLAREVDEALQLVHLPEFSLQILGVGHFPPRGRPHSLWAGTAPSPPLERLQARVEHLVRHAGAPPEKRNFAPHISLARLERAADGDVAGFLAAHSLLRTEPWTVSEFHLYSSTPGEEGARYAKLETYPLGDALLFKPGAE